ncbi:MAG TPA: NosD domain-containing protein [Candidatus Limnocylindria bacterium]|nr:NosD domain-containing protein [Candidatus Limnocylindria bacterium]
MRRGATLALALLLGCAPSGSLAQPTATPTHSPAATVSVTTSPQPPAASPSAPAVAATTVACGQQVAASIVVANDLACPGDALVVVADRVTIDLGGRTLRGPGMGPQTWPNPQLDSVGVRVDGRTDVAIRNGRITDFSTGIYLKRVDRATVEGITSVRSRYGLYVHESAHSTVRGNVIEANIYGLHLQGSSDNLVQGNRLVRQTYNSPGGYGIYLFESERNRITENDIEGNVNWGVWFSNAKGNVTVRNNIVGNRPNVSDNTEGNLWHDADRKEGNHWSDYPGRDTNGDGIGDTGAYTILGPADVVDPYPFVARDGWKKRSGPTIDTYVPPAAKAPKEVRLLAMTKDGSVLSARPGDGRASDTGIRATSIALQEDGRTLYALDGRRLAVWDARSGSSRVQEVQIADGVVAANRDGRSALVVSRTGAQQIDTTSGLSEHYAYRHAPVGIAPSYKHNHIFVGHEKGLDLFYLNLGGRIPYTIPLDGPALALTMNGSGTRVYVLVAAGLVDVVDTEQYRVVDRITLPLGGATALAVAPREDRLYVGYKGGVLVVDLKDKSVPVRQEAAFVGVVMDLALSPDGRELYAALGGLDQGIAVLRTADLTRADIIPLASLPLRLVAASY